MPLYQYLCDTCKDTYEKIQNFKDNPDEDCYKCSGKVRRVIGRTSFQLKGPGWYATDYGAHKE